MVKRFVGRRSLRRKLTLGALVALIAAQLCAATVLIAWERSRARDSLVDDLNMLSRIVVDNTAAALSFRDRDAAVETLGALDVHEGFEYACLYDEAGALFAEQVKSGGCPSAPALDGATFDQGLSMSTAVSAPDRGRVGTLTIRSSLLPVNMRLREQILETLVVLLLSSLAAIVLMTRLQRQLTEPLHHLAETAQAVSRDRDYSRRVQKEDDDEVGAVAESVNDMLSQIQTRDEELQNALRLKDEFLATVSHELRTPLNAMLGWSHVLRGTELAPAMLSQAAEAIDRNARMQARLIEDILDVSRIVTGKLRLEPREVDLATIVGSAIEVVQPSADAKSIAMQAAILDTAPFIGDPDRLRQVVWNLLSNAVKFTPSGGTVRVRLDEADSDYVIEVADTGRGIKADFLPHVFQPFRQADGTSTRSQGGLGLGLAIARHLTELSGGSIHVASAGLDRGATFSIRLPRPMRTPARVARPGERAELAWAALEGSSVLLVDDNDDTRAVLGTLLGAHGALVSTAASVAEARAALTEHLPDVLITDLAMPQEDGFELLQHCRRHVDPRLRALPILALTAYGGQEAEDRVLSAGFDAYLAKPVEPTEVGRMVQELRRRSVGRTRGERPMSTP